jgi:tetratricopeptide (TPR) repeat protein
MKSRTPLPLLSCLLASLLLTACADMSMPSFLGGGKANAAHSRAEPPARHGAAALKEGIALYNQGDFDAAIARLSSNDIANGPVATRVTALKYTAFSYCVTKRPAQCKQAFERALKLDPSFELAPGESGHPMWGPVFARAKKD